MSDTIFTIILAHEESDKANADELEKDTVGGRNADVQVYSR